jgi:hypothetical protein
MYQPSTGEIDADASPPERETVIKFVISGPFLNAEAAHTQWSNEPSPSAGAAELVMQDLVRRIADLERKLDEERALVERLSRQFPATPPEAEPAPPPTDRLPPAEPAPLRAGEAVAEPAPRTIAAPAPPPPLLTVARTPPPKVRGLRRMIGALRHL